MRYKIILLLLISLNSCSSLKQKDSFSFNLFRVLEVKKCNIGEIDGYLLRSGNFESVGSKNGQTLFTTFSNIKDFISVKTYTLAYSTKYVIATNNPDIYNFITKHGTYKGIKVDDRGITNLIYVNDNNEYLLHKEEPFSGGRLYFVTSECNK